MSDGKVDQKRSSIYLDPMCRWVPIEWLESSSNLLRSFEDEASLMELAENITQNGVINPISVVELIEDARYKIVAGERRYQAAQLADQTKVPIRIVSPSQARLIQLSENLQREDLSLLDEADALKALQIELGNVTIQVLAAKVNKTVSYVGRYLQIANASKDIRDLLADHPKLFTAVIAHRLTTEKDGKRRAAVIDYLLDKGPVPKAKKAGRPRNDFDLKPLKNGYDFTMRYRKTLDVKQKHVLLAELKNLVKNLEDELTPSTASLAV